jgi:hypothetical protein
MRHLMIASLVASSLVATPAVARSQEPAPSALGSRLSDFGGFVGLDLRFGDMLDEFAAFVGAEAMLLLRQRVYLGIRGGGLSTSNVTIPGGGSTSEVMGMGYGGLVVGYVFVTRSLADVNLDATLGAGGVGVRDSNDEKDWDPVFVFEPSATVDLKLARIARIGFGASYRFVGDVDVPGLRDADLRGIAGLVRIRVGRF